MSNWNEIWKSRTATQEKLGYVDLLKANGYDGKQSNLNPENLLFAQNHYSKEMGLERGDDIYEIACGAGAFLYHWSTIGHTVGGCDLSEGLLGCAERALPQGTWDHETAQSFPIGRRWDHLVSFGLCLYISQQELKELIARMIMKGKHSVSIFDIPDLDKKDECEAERERLIPNYREKYKGLEHFYHSKKELAALLESFSLRYKIYDQDIPGYENGKYRFNITIEL